MSSCLSNFIYQRELKFFNYIECENTTSSLICTMEKYELSLDRTKLKVRSTKCNKIIDKSFLVMKIIYMLIHLKCVLLFGIIFVFIFWDFLWLCSSFQTCYCLVWIYYLETFIMITFINVCACLETHFIKMVLGLLKLSSNK